MLCFIYKYLATVIRQKWYVFEYSLQCSAGVYGITQQDFHVTAYIYHTCRFFAHLNTAEFFQHHIGHYEKIKPMTQANRERREKKDTIIAC